MHIAGMESQNINIHPSSIPEMERAILARGIPVAELCRRANVAETTWGRWKRGAVSPTFKSWDAVTEAYRAIIENQTQEGAT